MPSGKILVAQGGGPTAVINQSLVGVVLESRRFQHVTRVYGALHGVRGKPAVDVEAAAVAVARLSEVAAAHPEIGELEINPLLVSPDGAQGLDARLVLAAHGAASALNLPLQAGPACQA